MKCPIDGAELVMTDRQGVEIDYCSQCRGVWLDRGELDKIIDRVGSSSPDSNYQPQRYEHDRPQERPREREQHREDYGHNKKKHKRENFLGDLFDF